MNPFWNGFCEHLENCGRNAALFIFCTLVGLPIVLVVLGVVTANWLTELWDSVLPGLPWIGFLVAGWFCLALRRAMVRRRERLQRGPLSELELRKARGKLVGNRK